MISLFFGLLFLDLLLCKNCYLHWTGVLRGSILIHRHFTLFKYLPCLPHVPKNIICVQLSWLIYVCNCAPLFLLFFFIYFHSTPTTPSELLCCWMDVKAMCAKASECYVCVINISSQNMCGVQIHISVGYLVGVESF